MAGGKHGCKAGGKGRVLEDEVEILGVVCWPPEEEEGVEVELERAAPATASTAAKAMPKGWAKPKQWKQWLPKGGGTGWQGWGPKPPSTSPPRWTRRLPPAREDLEEEVWVEVEVGEDEKNEEWEQWG